MPHLWHETNIEKVIILQASLQTVAKDGYADINEVMRGAILRQQQHQCTNRTPLRHHWNGLTKLNDTDWLTSAWKWMTEQSISVNINMDIPEPYENDVCVIETVIRYKTDCLSNDARKQLKHVKQGIAVKLIPELDEVRKDIWELQYYLQKHKIVYKCVIPNYICI